MGRYQMQDTSISEQKIAKLEKHLERRSQFERVIFALSSKLTHYENDSMGDIIQGSLGEMESITDAKRIYLFLYDKTASQMIYIYEWCNKNNQTQLEIFKEIVKKNPGWLEGKLKEAENINFEDPAKIKQIPPEIQDLITDLSVKSMIVFPIFVNYDVEGFLTFNDPLKVKEWTDDDYSFLRMVLQIIGMALDRILGEQKLKKSEEKYRSILENIKEAYFEIDLAGVFTFFNYALCNLSGYSSNEILGKLYTFFMQDWEKEKITKFLNSAHKNLKGIQNLEVELKRKDGKRTDVESTFYPKQDAQGNVIGYRGFLRDITERKKSEELREKFTQRLELEVKGRTKELNATLEQQKLYLDQILKSSQFKSEFMATMSHELRTPLNAIIGFSELLVEKLYGELNSKQIEFLKDIHSSGEQLLEMINRILDISKIEAGKLQLNIQLVSLNEIILQIESTMRPIYSKKGLQFTFQGFEKERLVYADPIRLKEIIQNLISNAIKYTPAGSITIKYSENDKYSEISVVDTGIGIAEKDHKRVFKEFERIENQLSQSTQGTGLGLSLTRRLIHLHGGEISFKSEEGKGSTFTFTIPKKYGLA